MSGEDLPPGATTEEDEEEALASLQAPQEDTESEPRAESAVGAGASVIRRQLKHAPNAPGVYRMIAANGDVLYVGKARNIRARIAAYARGQAHTNRIA
ncbi:MAG: GIY-YIG nuclease family protein, partial [Hyphomicrobiales bacterium]|nr:GIY-YIG nuclease family protein [Hyphomicrobiales bacterium]